MDLYGCRLTLRNCGRFLHVASDYGSIYTTHAHLSSEMLYVGLSRERTRVANDFTSLMKRYDFFSDFEISRWPIWFTPAMLSDHGQIGSKSKAVTDINQFNSMREATPGIQDNDRLPKFGSMETILPDQRFTCYAFSPQIDLLTMVEPGQVYWMGKKRTMFEIMDATGTVPLSPCEGSCQTPSLQVGPRDLSHFSQIRVFATTQRYVLLTGRTKGGIYWRIPPSEPLEQSQGLPEFVLQPVLQHFRHVA